MTRAERRVIRFVLTFEIIIADLSELPQAIHVWTMKCVGYDEAFQQELYTKYPVWLERERTRA